VTQSRLSVMAAASVGVSPRAGPARQGQKTRDAPGRKCHPAVRGQGARWHHSPQAFLPPPLGEHRFAGNTVFRGTPALREHRLVGQAFVMHEPPMARLSACEQLPVDVVTAHAKRAGTVRRHAALVLATAVTAQGEPRVLTSQ
jgi:hypothetical protein